MSKIIEITVLRNGQARVVTKGFDGSECRQASQFLEKALGITKAEKLTLEFHQRLGTQQATRLRD